MKRKKWTEEEESTLITRYGELMRSGTLPKLKTRVKKFDPIAHHVNSAHHHRDPFSFPFRWTWRDVSIKIQNMRHQYLGVKQKIRIPSSPNQFNWSEGDLHWKNFLHYKHVFGDIDLDPPDNIPNHPSNQKLLPGDCEVGENVTPVFSYDGFVDAHAGNSDMLDLGLGIDGEDDGHGDDDDAEGDRGEGDEEGDDGDDGDLGFVRGMKRPRKGSWGGKVMLEMEEEASIWRSRREREARRKEREERALAQEMEWEERERTRVRREFERRMRVEKEFEEERQRRMKMEEKREEEEMEWRERMVEMQMEHEKQMMQMYAEACHGQMQVLGVLARLVCQFFGSGADGLGTGMTAIPSNLQHPGSLVGDNGKPDGNSSAHFM